MPVPEIASARVEAIAAWIGSCHPATSRASRSLSPEITGASGSGALSETNQYRRPPPIGTRPKRAPRPQVSVIPPISDSSSSAVTARHPT
jgi:hypothetical protein